MVIVYVEIAITFLLYFYLQIYAILTRKSEIKFLEKMMDIDSRVTKTITTKKFSYRKFKEEMKVMLMLTTAFFYVLAGIVVYFMVRVETSIGPVVIFVGYIHQSVSNAVFVVGFCARVKAISTFFQLITNDLKTLSDNEVITSRNESKANQMLNITNLHKNLCARIEELSDLTGFPMLLNFAHDFILLTIQIFAFLFVVNLGMSNDSNVLMTAIVLWMVPNVTKIAFTCGLCHLAKNQVGIE